MAACHRPQPPTEADNRLPRAQVGSAAKEPAGQKWETWFEIGLIFLICFIAGGAPVPHVNETHYLAKAKHYWQPAWCAGDLFLESGKAHLTFYWTVGLLTKWFSLATVAWIGRVAAWLLLAIAWQRLSRTVVGIRLGSVLTAMLLVTLVNWSNFAGEWVVGGVEGKCFAYALVFWGLAALAHQRWRRVWPCLGLAGAFHVLVGGWATIAAGLVWLFQRRGNRPSLRSILPSLLLGGMLSLPGVVPALQLTQEVSPATVDRANQIYVFDRLPHHLAPLSLKPAELARKSWRFGLLLLGLVGVRLLCNRESLPGCRQPADVEDDDAPYRRLELVMQFAVAALLISVVGLAWELMMWNHPAVAARLLKYYWFRLADIAVPVATSLGIGWLIQALQRRSSRWGVWLLAFAVALPAWHLHNVSWERYRNPRPPAARKIRDFGDYLEACAWAAEQTPPQSLFLVPRRAHSFKWYAGRSDLVTWKDVPQNAADLLTWHARFFDVNWHYNEEGEYVSIRRLAKQGTARMRALAEKYDLDYILTIGYPPLDLPVAYSNNSYTIYATKATSP